MEFLTRHIDTGVQGSQNPKVHHPLWVLGFLQEITQRLASVEFKGEESLLVK